MHHIKTISQELSLNTIAPYYHHKRFLALCKECPNYDVVWSCPPYNFKPETLLAGFSYIKIFGFKIVFEDLCQSNHTMAIAKAKKIMEAEKRRADAKVLEMEQDLNNSQALYSGSCRLCRDCTRILERPCRHLDLMRYSLESLGYDVEAIAKDILNLPLLWYKNRLPPYMVLITALLYNK